MLLININGVEKKVPLKVRNWENGLESIIRLGLQKLKLLINERMFRFLVFILLKICGDFI